jgi:hypothetical protein
MLKWAAITTVMVIITGITVTIANGIPRSRFDPHCPAAAVDTGRPVPLLPTVQAATVSGGASITQMGIPFYAPTF